MRRSSVRPPVWCVLVIALAVFALGTSLATRTFHGSVSFHITAKATSNQAIRQHLDRDGFHWVAPMVAQILYEAPVAYPYTAPAGPPLPVLLLEVSLSNRPPPTC